MATFIPAVELIYRELARPKAPQPVPTCLVAEVKKTITRADVNELIQRTRPASAEELQYIIDHAKELNLTDREHNQLGLDLSILVAQRSRGVNRRRDDPAAEFIHKVLGLEETPYGMIERSGVNEQMRCGSQSIARCRNHRSPECQCWAVSRAILWQASANGPKTPEAWAAARIYGFLAELELASRPETEPGQWTGWPGNRHSENMGMQRSMSDGRLTPTAVRDSIQVKGEPPEVWRLLSRTGSARKTTVQRGRLHCSLGRRWECSP